MYGAVGLSSVSGKRIALQSVHMAGEVYAIGLKLMTTTGAIDLYPVGEQVRRTVIETRNRAQFRTESLQN